MDESSRLSEEAISEGIARVRIDQEWPDDDMSECAIEQVCVTPLSCFVIQSILTSSIPLGIDRQKRLSSGMDRDRSSQRRMW